MNCVCVFFSPPAHLRPSRPGMHQAPRPLQSSLHNALESAPLARALERLVPVLGPPGEQEAGPYTA
eukprot:3817439-Pyramimonas_sp.AAC.1